ncbi:MAG: 2-oxoacid:acceptor oxidoreductase family protein [Chloroflexi bacterium]|nr:2-oxoacid:acceptor oxidoreductase family protein [Chloroflexota bacterium]
MHHEIIISGFGGQGALFAGQLLAYGALAEERHVTWIPSYGPEMRGGTANCTVIVSDEEIGSPLVRHPTAAIVLNPPSFDRYEPLIQKDGVLLVNTSLISSPPQRSDIRRIDVQANELATDLGTAQMANVILLGALVAATGVVRLETLDQVLDEHVSARHRDKLEANKRALRVGAAQASKQ